MLGIGRLWPLCEASHSGHQRPHAPLDTIRSAPRTTRSPDETKPELRGADRLEANRNQHRDEGV
jgi:hypothetical protein